MDDKTAELRDIFLDATDGEGTVTERQAERRGSLVDGDGDDADVDARLRDIVATMRERYDFDTDLDAAAYVALIRGFYEGDDDAALAERVGVEGEEPHSSESSEEPRSSGSRTGSDGVDTARRARLDCHLVREDDAETPAVEASRERAVRANGRFRDAFADLLTDDDLSTRLASDSREDGLREATEDIETDVSF